MSGSLLALTHVPSPRLAEGQRTHVERVPINFERALEQHAAYCRMLTRCGARVRTLDINRDLPDSVFIEDNAVVLDEVAVLASMGGESRRAEVAGIEPELRKLRPLARIELPATLEGGDVFRVDRTLFVGLSCRTNEAGVRALQAIAERHGYRVIAVPLRDCLHLKTACTPLPDGSLLVHRTWVDERALDGFELIPIPEDEPWAADVLLVGKTVCAPEAHPRTADLIRKRGFEVETVDLSEFAKAEGGITCLSILVKLNPEGVPFSEAELKQWAEDDETDCQTLDQFIGELEESSENLENL